MDDFTYANAEAENNNHCTCAEPLARLGELCEDKKGWTCKAILNIIASGQVSSERTITEGIRGLLETEFEAVVMVANETSLIESAAKLRPRIVVADLALAQGESFGWLRRLLVRCPESRVIVLSDYDELTVKQAAFAAGATGFVHKRAIATQLLDAVDEVLAGRRYTPPDGGKVVLPVKETKRSSH